MIKEGSRYTKAGINLMAVILFLPLLLLALIFYGIYYSVKTPALKKEYKKSRYYTDLKQRFSHSAVNSPQYRFYNAAAKRNLPIDYHKQKSNGLEFFIYKETLYLFPDFYTAQFDEQKGAWSVGWHSDNQEPLSEYINSLTAKLDSEVKNPVKILCERKLFNNPDLKDNPLPEEIYLINNYDLAFDSRDLARQDP